MGSRSSLYGFTEALTTALDRDGFGSVKVQGLVAKTRMREDFDSIAAQEYRRQELDPLFTETDESELS